MRLQQQPRESRCCRRMTPPEPGHNTSFPLLCRFSDAPILLANVRFRGRAVAKLKLRTDRSISGNSTGRHKIDPFAVRRRLATAARPRQRSGNKLVSPVGRRTEIVALFEPQGPTDCATETQPSAVDGPQSPLRESHLPTRSRARSVVQQFVHRNDQ